MQAVNPIITLLVLAPLLIWRLYSRIRRMVGRQRLSRVRPWITVILFPLLVLLLASAGYARPELLLWLAGGLASGGLLAAYGLRRTQFETTPQGLFYTPHAHLGIALSLLLVSRILYRLVEVYYLGRTAPSALPISREVPSHWSPSGFSPATTSHTPRACCVGATA